MFLSREKTQSFIASSREGVTIVVAVLILAIVVIITFSIGALAIREIRNSRLQTHTEPAISAADGGAETVLFFRSRNLTGLNTACGNSSNDMEEETYPGSGIFSSTYEACTDYYGDVPFTSTAANTKVFLLNNPIEPSNNEAGYNQIQIMSITHDVATLQFAVHLYDLENPDLCPIQRGPFSTGTGSRTITGLQSTKSYAVFIYPCGDPGKPPRCSGGGSVAPSCSSGNMSGILTGTATGVTGGPYTGVPRDDLIVESTGEREGLLRKLQIILDKPGS